METQGHFQCPITCLTQVSIGWMVKHLCMFQHCFMSHLLDNTLTAFSSNMFKCLCLKYEERYNLVVGVAVVACNGIGWCKFISEQRLSGHCRMHHYSTAKRWPHSKCIANNTLHSWAAPFSHSPPRNTTSKQTNPHTHLLCSKSTCSKAAHQLPMVHTDFLPSCKSCSILKRHVLLQAP